MRSANIRAKREENSRRIKLSTESIKTNINVPGLVARPVVQFNVLGSNEWLIDHAAQQIPSLAQHIPPLAQHIPPLAQHIFPRFRAFPQ